MRPKKRQKVLNPNYKFMTTIEILNIIEETAENEAEDVEENDREVIEDEGVENEDAELADFDYIPCYLLIRSGCQIRVLNRYLN